MIDVVAGGSYHRFNIVEHGQPMEVVLRKYGNSTVLALPPAMLRELGLKAGQVMTLAASPDGRITLVPKRRYRLADLLAQCDPKAPPPADLEPWNRARPVGREVW